MTKMNDEKHYSGQISWSAWNECRRHAKAYIISWLVSIAGAFLICTGIPTTYSAQVKIADEHHETDLLLGLNNVASWAKGMIDKNKGMQMPEVYYQIVSSPSFVDEMSKVIVEKYHTDYYHYIVEHHRSSFWEKTGQWLSEDSLTEKQDVTRIIAQNIRSKVSRKYGTVVMQVTDQDPEVAAMMVDSVRVHLQEHLNKYSRRKAIIDLETAIQKMEQANRNYEKARNEYIRFRDTHKDLSSVKANSMEDHLLKEYENKFSSYSKAREQYIRSKALVDKFSYKFAILKNATVPHEPSGPSVIGYALAFLFISTVFVTWCILGMRTYNEYHQKG